MTASQNRPHDRQPEHWTGDFLPDVNIEMAESGLIELEQQQGCQDPVTVAIHPSQVLYIAQKAGLLPGMTQDQAAAREALQSRIRELERDQRRLRLTLLACSDRTEQLFQSLVVQQERGHEDLALEVAKAAALADILDLAKADFEDEFGEVDLSDSKRAGLPTTIPQVVMRTASKAAASPLATGESIDLFSGKAGA